MRGGQFLYKISCPGGTHEDLNPSCAVYSDGNGYCFACNTPFKEVTQPDLKVVKRVENIYEKMAYIKQLPTQKLRGFEFPFDSSGYYIVWPGGGYYKLRRWDNSHPSGRYSSPVGIVKPWFYANRKERPTKSLIMVEGEINAMSVAVAFPEYDVISPGSATNFMDSYSRNKLISFPTYSKVLILTDNDPSGLEAGVKMKAELVKRIPRTTIYLMNEDANSIHTNYDEKELRKQIEALGVL